MVPLVAVVVIVLAVLSAYAPAFGQSPAGAGTDPAVAELGKDFVSRVEPLSDVRLHYVRGGDGPAVVLVHGFPQDWYAFHAVIPRLAQKFTVIAVDLPGVGRSSAGLARYDSASIAERLLQLIRKLRLGRVYIAGHDNGGMVAYTFGRLYPDDTRGVM
ncbi:MAG: alpha/beta fold hydrolase, partial [Steroidobacteraceae bacterium]